MRKSCHWFNWIKETKAKCNFINWIWLNWLHTWFYAVTDSIAVSDVRSKSSPKKTKQKRRIQIKQKNPIFAGNFVVKRMDPLFVCAKYIFFEKIKCEKTKKKMWNCYFFMVIPLDICIYLSIYIYITHTMLLLGFLWRLRPSSNTDRHTLNSNLRNRKVFLNRCRGASFN